MSVTNLHNLPEKAWDRIFFYLAKDDQSLRSLLFTSKVISAQISRVLHLHWESTINQRPIATKMWKQMEEGSPLTEKIVSLLRRFDFVVFLKSRANRSSQSQSDSSEEWLEDFRDVEPREFQRLKPLLFQSELDIFQARLTDFDLFRVAILKGDLEWCKSFDLNEMEIRNIDEAALLSLESLSGNPLIFDHLLPNTSVYKGENEKESSRILTRLINRAAVKDLSAEFKVLTHLNKPFSYGEVLTTLARKNLVPQIRILLNLEKVEINKTYIASYESQLGVLSSNGLHATILAASLAASIEAIQEILTHFPDSIPYNILRHARDLLRVKANAKFGEEKHPIYEKGHNRLYRYLPIPDQWRRACTIPDHQRICRLLSKEIIRRFPDPTSFQDECLTLRKLPLKQEAVIMIDISFKK